LRNADATWGAHAPAFFISDLAQPDLPSLILFRSLLDEFFQASILVSVAAAVRIATPLCLPRLANSSRSAVEEYEKD
jgi:hypothetical protein